MRSPQEIILEGHMSSTTHDGSDQIQEVQDKPMNRQINPQGEVLPAKEKEEEKKSNPSRKMNPNSFRKPNPIRKVKPYRRRKQY